MKKPQQQRQKVLTGKWNQTFIFLNFLHMELLWSRNTLNKTTWIKSLATKWGNSLINQQAGKHYLRVGVVILIPKSCLTLWDPRDSSLPGFSVHWIFQARILEWVAISFSRESSWPRDWTRVFCNVGRFFTIWATRETLLKIITC